MGRARHARRSAKVFCFFFSKKKDLLLPPDVAAPAILAKPSVHHAKDERFRHVIDMASLRARG